MMKWTVAVLLFGCLSAANGWFWKPHSGHHGYGRGTCQQPNPIHHRDWWSWMPGYQTPDPCTSDPTLSIPCTCTDPDQPLEGILDLIVADNDNDDNGFVTSADIVSDVTKNYDTNYDGLWSEKECVTRWSCKYAGNYTISNYICSLLFGGEPSTSISSFNNIGGPFAGAGLPVEAFRQINEDRFNQYRDSSCTKGCLTIAQKVELNAKNNDYNNDGMVTGDNVQDDLTDNYDTDNNGIVTKAEWVTGFVCAYGDSADYARYLFDLTAGQDINITAAGQRFQAVSVEAREYTFLQRYNDYIDVNPFYADECCLSRNRQKTCTDQYVCQNNP